MVKKNRKRKFIKKTIKFLFTLTLFFLVGLISTFFIVTHNTTLDSSKLSLASTLPVFAVYSSNGTNIIKENSFSSKTVSIDLLSKHTIDAFLTSEDRTFYSHRGIDYKRIAGALYNNIKSKKIKQGGSTISQQLIKNTHLSSEKTLTRKLKEIKLTKILEKNYSKNKILEIYLNTIYFGNGCYGIEDASNFYFNKSAKDLSVAESAMLAGIISSPTYNEPTNHFEKATQKKNLILSNMNKLGKISNEKYNLAKQENIIIHGEKDETSTSNQYIKSVISEASKILKIT